MGHTETGDAASDTRRQVGNRWRDEDGAVLILMNLALMVLLGFAALVLDLGNARQQRLGAQTAADAAALAAVQELTGVPDLLAAQAVARSYVTANGFDGSVAEVNVPPTSGDHAGLPTCIEVKPAKDVPATFGRVFGVDSLSVRARAVACAGSEGGAGQAIFAGSTTCQNAIDWSGSTTQVNGGVHTNHDLHVGGSTNVVNGQAAYLSSLDAPPDKITFNPAASNPSQLANPQPYPVRFDIGAYAPSGARASLALSQGTYHDAGNDKIDMGWLTSRGLWNDATKTLAPGLYYTTNDIDLSASSINGNGVTFVSAGQISLSGSEHILTPWDPDGLLAFSNHQKDSDPYSAANCVSPGVKLSGSTHSWAGIVYAPRSEIEMSGSSNTTFNGALVGWTVKLNGSGLNINYDKRLSSESSTISLTE
jgi:hypothetical protein